MAIFTVYEPPLDNRSDVARAGDLVFVRDDFSRATFALGPLWLLLNRRWVGLSCYLLGALAMVGIVMLFGLGPRVWGYMYLTLNLLAALEEPLIYGIVLERRGWRQIGASEGQNEEEAEYRFLSAWLKTKHRSDPPQAALLSPAKGLKSSASGVLKGAVSDHRPPRTLN